MSQADRDKWERKYAEGWQPADGPSAFIRECAPHLPLSGRALDVGGGLGRHALWLAERGLEVTLVDISETALGRAQAAADEAGLSLRTLAADLDMTPPPAGPWDVVVMTFFLWRPLFEALPDLLAPTGLLVCELPTRRNLERHAKPGLPFLLEEGELRALVEAHLTVVEYVEGWNTRERHTARVLARQAVGD